jgi:hypothetical protein
VGGQQDNDNNLLLGGAVSSGPFVMGLCLLGVGGGNRGNTRHNLLGVNNGSSGCCWEGLGHLDKPCLSSGSALPLFRRRGLREKNSGGNHCGKGPRVRREGTLARASKDSLLEQVAEAGGVRGGIGGVGGGGHGRPGSGGLGVRSENGGWRGMHTEALIEGTESNGLDLGPNSHGMLDEANFGDCVDSLEELGDKHVGGICVEVVAIGGPEV